MSALRRLLACLLAATVVPSAAIAATATSEVVPADEARAKAMLLRKSDFAQGFEQRRPGSGGGSPGLAAGPDCRGLRIVDLEPTGAARSDFTRGPQIVQSYAYVYATSADATAAHRSFSGKAGRRCFSSAFRTGLGPSARLVSLKSMPFPRVADRSVAFRALIKFRVRDVTALAYADFVMLQHSRAQAVLLAASGLVPLQQGELRQLARIVAGRMKTAMRGA